MCKANGDKDWVVRYTRRTDGRISFHALIGMTPRVSEADRFTRSEAIMLAKAIRNGCREYSARAMRFVNTDKGTIKEVAE